MAEKIVILENGVYFDFSRSLIHLEKIDEYQELTDKALKDLADLESGEIVNIEENRMAGHYWLRDSELSPTSDIEEEIENGIKEVREFSQKVMSGDILNKNDEAFEGMVYVGIGGSALGPQLIHRVFGNNESFDIRFVDNTDPESFFVLTNELGERLKRYLIVIVSKSGNTKETANMMDEFIIYFRKNGWSGLSNFIAITTPESNLEKKAVSENWLKVFHIWDWVGGRTSIASAVGLLPLNVMGRSDERFLEGLKAADKVGRRRAYHNPILLMALELFLNKSLQDKNQLVVLPYKDKLELFPKYLQQLIMESIGKDGEGIAVYGNKGSSDQHSYVQQLFDGPNNLSLHFITVRKYEQHTQLLPNGNYSADYLQAFYLGTAKAIFEAGRHSVSVSIPELNEFYLGFLIGIYERLTGFYASFTDINAYNQPAVEKGKTAAEKVMLSKNKIIELLKNSSFKEFSCDELAVALEIEAEEVFTLLEYMHDSELYPLEKSYDKEDCNFKNTKYQYKSSNL